MTGAKETQQDQAEPEAQAPAPRNIHEAILAVYAQVGYVPKKGRLSSGKASYSYAREEEFIAALRPAMIEVGIYQSPHDVQVLTNDRIESEKVWEGKTTKVYQHRVVIKVTYRLTHAPSGGHIDVPAFGEGMDSGDKSFNKAMTAANKYALRQAFMIETGDDPDKYASKDTGGVEEGDGKESGKLFVTAAARKTFCGNVISSFQNALTLVDLQNAWEANAEKLGAMNASKHDHDTLGYEEIVKQYKQSGAKLKQAAQVGGNPAKRAPNVDQMMEEGRGSVPPELQY